MSRLVHAWTIDTMIETNQAILARVRSRKPSLDG